MYTKETILNGTIVQEIRTSGKGETKKVKDNFFESGRYWSFVLKGRYAKLRGSADLVSA